MATRPANDVDEVALPEWATGGSAAVVEPSAGVKAVGWEGGEEPPAEWFNWWQLLVYQWIALLDVVYRGVKVYTVEAWRFATAGLATFGWTAAGSFAATIEEPSSTGHLKGHRYLKIAGGTGVNSGTVEGLYFHHFTDTSDVDVEWSQSIDSYGTSTSYNVECGINFLGSITTYRIVFKKTAASAAWFYHVQDATGTTSATTGVTATAAQVYRMRIEYRGNAGSNSTVRFYIDGDLVATVTDANVPINDRGKIYIKNNAADGGTIGHLFVGPIAIAVQPE